MEYDVEYLLKNWGAWARDIGNWRKTCCSMERKFINDPCRYGNKDDIEKQFKFRYEQNIAEKAENIVKNMDSRQEKDILRAIYVFFPHLPDEQLARMFGVNLEYFEKKHLSALNNFMLRWNQ